MHVDVSVLVKAINNFNEIEGVLKVVCGIPLSWRDELIRWNPSDYGLTVKAQLPFLKVWTPSLFLLNSATNFQVKLGGEISQSVSYFLDGSAWFTTAVITSTTCSPNAKYYPFDLHHCRLVFTSLVSPKDVNLYTGEHISTYTFETNSIWELESTYGKNDSSQGISIVEVHIRIRRRPTFLLINIFAPILFLAFANLLVFVIPIDSGERVSFAVTILLSFAVFLTLVMDKMPQTSLSVSLFSVYLILTMTYSFLIMLTLVFILSLYFSEASEPKGLLFSLFTQKKLRKSASNKLHPICEESNDNVNPSKAAKDQVCTSSGETNEMKRLAAKLDKICGIAFFTFFIVMTVIFMGTIFSA
jgi:hypothetical protein